MIKKIALIKVLLITSVFASPPALEFMIAHTSSDMDYRTEDTTVNNQDDQATTGDLMGFTLGANVILNDGLMFGNVNYLKLRYSRVSGSSDYQETNSTGIPINERSMDNKISDFSAMFTEDIYTPKYRVYAGVGGGYSNHKRSFPVDENTSSGIEGDTIYVAAELGANYTIFDWLNMGVVGTYKHAINPKIESSLIGNSSTFKSGGGNAYKLTVPVTFIISKDLSFFMEYEKEYWDMKKSDTVEDIYYPAATRATQKVSVGFNFKMN